MIGEELAWCCQINGEMFEFSIWASSECTCCGTTGRFEATLDGIYSGRTLCMSCAGSFYDVPEDSILVMKRVAEEERGGV